MTAKTTKKGVVKGTVAAAAGAAVLLGGMGTFALWNTEGQIGDASMKTGELSVTDWGEMSWQDVTPGHANTVGDIADFRLVPGDKLVGTSEIDVTAQGENIVVKPTVGGEDGASLTSILPPTLADDVDVTVALEPGDGVDADGNITAGDHTITANVTIEYKWSEDDQNTGQSPTGGADDKTIDLSQVYLHLEQVEPTAP